MRIVGGIYKGRALSTFKGEEVRPTSDKVRESLFNIFQFKIQGSKFLDLFCGTGAMGIEALSRGAEEVVLNDFSRESLKIAKSNVEKIGKPQNIKIYNFDAINFLNTTSEKFDYVFIDPPYKTDLGERALEIVYKVLNAGGVAIYENEKPFCKDIDRLVKTDQRKYGRAILTFFELKENK